MMDQTARASAFALFATYVITSCGGLYLMKAAPQWKTLTFLCGLGFYGAGAVMWLVILRMVPLSYAFPIAAGSLMIGTMLSGYFLLSETLTPWHMIGAVMILGGITMIVLQR